MRMPSRNGILGFYWVNSGIVPKLTEAHVHSQIFRVLHFVPCSFSVPVEFNTLQKSEAQQFLGLLVCSYISKMTPNIIVSIQLKSFVA